MNLTICKLDNVIDELFDQYSYSITESDEFKNLKDSLTLESLSKLALVIAYEMQDLMLDEDIYSRYAKFWQESYSKMVADKNIGKTVISTMLLSKSLALQCLVPKNLDSLYKEAYKSNSSYSFITVSIKALFEALASLKDVEEADFNNVIMKCVYDYETDNLYHILLSYCKIDSKSFRTIINHPISFSDDSSVIDVFIDNAIIAYGEYVTKGK